MIGDPQHFGKPISEMLSKYLLEFTDQTDRANVSQQTSISTSTIRDVVYRRNTLTETNYIGIVELMRIAVANCTQKIKTSKQAKSFIEIQLKNCCHGKS
jgi:hypothetical protein